jgi:uncharacterized protein involved in exopolysaccharide biosynthesis
MIAEIRFYLALFMRRMPLFFLVFTVIATAGIFAAFTLPPIYRAQARLLVESSQIPGNLAASTVDLPAREQLQLFEARLMTRDNLLEIANELQPIADQDKMTPDQIVLAMRAATSIRTSSGRDQATLMTLSFDSAIRAMTAAVLDEYLNVILEEDAQYRADRAGQTEQFFRQEVERLGTNLSTQSARILAFKNENANALPEGLDYRRDLQLSLQDRITQYDRELNSQTEQQQRLKQIFETTGQIETNQQDLSLEETRLKQLKTELFDLEGVYASTSPRVITLKNRIAQLEKSILATSSQNVQDIVDPATAMFELQIGEIDLRIKQLNADRIKATEQLAAVEAEIAATPANAIALEALERDYENTQGQYNQAVNRLAAASTGERIETLSRGQRITVIEQPSVPDEPYKPNRKRIAAMGVAGGLAAGGGLLVILELMSSTVKRSADLVNKLQITPLVTIPYMSTRRETLRRRILRITISLAIFLAIPISLWAIHTFYIPFDILARRIAARFGLYI